MNEGARIGRNICRQTLAWFIVGCVGHSAFADGYTWLGTTGNWHDGTKWGGGTPPPNDGTAVVHFTNATCTSTITTNWSLPGGSTNGAVYGFIFETGTLVTTMSPGSGFGSLTVGAGGIIVSNTSRQKTGSNLTLVAGASQTWRNGQLWFSGSLRSDPGVVVIITNGMNIMFDYGDSDGFLGSFVWDQGIVTMANNGAGSVGKRYGRLGTGGVRTGNGGQNSIQFDGRGADVFPTPLTLGLADGTPFNKDLRLWIGAHAANTNGGQGGMVDLTGGLSGKCTGIGPTKQNSTPTGGGIWFDNSYCWGNTSGGPEALASLYTHWYGFLLSGSGNMTCDVDPATTNLATVLIKSSTVILNNVNALGASNSAAIGIGDWNYGGIGNVSALLANNGINVTAPVRIWQNAVQNYAQSDICEMGINGSGTVEFKGNIYLEAGALGPRRPILCFVAASGGVTRVSGVIQDTRSPFYTYTTDYYAPVVILGGLGSAPEGTVELSGSNTYHGVTAVRAGTLLVANAQALGNSSSLLLGDIVVPLSPVVAATPGFLTTSTIGTTVSSWSSGVFTFAAAVTALDGVTLNTGDRVLVKDEVTTARNGIYVVTDNTHWTRASDFDAIGDLTYGQQVYVQRGALAGGKQFYLPSFDNSWNWAFSTNGLAFNEDAVNPDVALLANGSFTVTNAINVTSNNSTGKSLLGSTGTVAAAFSGPIALNRDATLTSSANGIADFQGDIAGAFGVTEQGAGLVKFSTNKTYTGSTTVTSGGFEVRGTLASTNVTFASGASYVVELGGPATNQFDHMILPNGGVTLGSAALTVKLTGGYAPPAGVPFPVIQVQGPGTVSGTFAGGGSVLADDGTNRFLVTYTGTSVVLQRQVGRGTTILVR